MDLSSIIVLSLVIFIAAFIQGSVGIGFALIVAPVLGLFSPELIPVALLILMLPLNFYIAARERHSLDQEGFTWISLGRLPGTFVGTAILLIISSGALNIFVGLSTVVAALLSLVAPSFVPGRKTFALAGLITGVTETATGIGGPPLALVYQHHSGPVLRSTLGACFLFGEVLSLIFLTIGGKITMSLLGDSLLLMPAVIVGAFLSRLVHKKVGGKHLRAAVMAFAIAAGLFLLAKEIF